MRLVRLQGTEGSEPLALHPRLTVLSGLSPEMRELLLSTVAGLPRGEHVTGGAIEVHGVMLDLTPTNLGLLELSTELDVVVRADDLPTNTAVDETPPTASPASRAGDALGRPAGLGIKVIGDESARSAAEQRVAAAIAAHLRANETLQRHRDDLAAVRAERQQLAVEYDEVRRAVDPFAASALADANAQLAEARSAIAGQAAAEHDSERSRVEGRLGELIDWSGRLKRELGRLSSIDTGPVAQALEAYRAASNPDNSPWPPAVALIEHWTQALAEPEAVDPPQEAAVSSRLGELTAARDAAYDAFVEAEQALRRPALDSELVREVETVHDELFELEDRVRGLGAGRQRRRQAMLRERETELLSALGFDSWGSYVAGIHTEGREAERLRRYEVAKAAYELAEDELASGAPPVVAEAAESAPSDDRSALIEATKTLLGTTEIDEDPRSALLAFRPPEYAEAGHREMDVAASHLQGALRAAGVDLGAGTATGVELADAADRWLRSLAGLETTLEGARQQHGEIEAEIANLAVRLEELSDPVDVEGWIAASDVVAEHQRAVGLAEQRLARHEAAAARVVEMQQADAPLNERDESLTAELLRAEQDVGLAQEEVAAAQSAVQRLEARPQPEAAPRPAAAVGGLPDPEALEWYLLARLSAQRSTSFVGSVPLVIDDAFSAWPVDLMGDVFARLERMSDVVQILYLSDDPEVIRWADDLGEERAAVVTAQS